MVSRIRMAMAMAMAMAKKVDAGPVANGVYMGETEDDENQRWREEAARKVQYVSWTKYSTSIKAQL
jgi:hypothetical protein